MGYDIEVETFTPTQKRLVDGLTKNNNLDELRDQRSNLPKNSHGNIIHRRIRDAYNSAIVKSLMKRRGVI